MLLGWKAPNPISNNQQTANNPVCLLHVVWMCPVSTAVLFNPLQIVVRRAERTARDLTQEVVVQDAQEHKRMSRGGREDRCPTRACLRSSPGFTQGGCFYELQHRPGESLPGRRHSVL